MELTPAERERLRRLDTAAMCVCIGSVGLAFGMALGALLLGSWSSLAVAVLLVLVAYLMTFVGEYCHERTCDECQHDRQHDRQR